MVMAMATQHGFHFIGTPLASGDTNLHGDIQFEVVDLMKVVDVSRELKHPVATSIMHGPYFCSIIKLLQHIKTTAAWTNYCSMIILLQHEQTVVA
jgi:hypothetical protein